MDRDEALGKWHEHALDVLYAYSKYIEAPWMLAEIVSNGFFKKGAFLEGIEYAHKREPTAEEIEYAEERYIVSEIRHHICESLDSYEPEEDKEKGHDKLHCFMAVYEINDKYREAIATLVPDWQDMGAS